MRANAAKDINPARVAIPVSKRDWLVAFLREPGNIKLSAAEVKKVMTIHLGKAVT